jgi:glucuronate isomerase
MTTLIGTKTNAIRDFVAEASVFDTHTHLDTSANVAAESAWDILHYFWFKRELCAVGYPEHAEELEESTRRTLVLDALDKSRNTYWNTIVRRILSDLYDISLERPADFDALAEKLAHTSTDPDWPIQVCARLHVKNIVVDESPMEVSDEFRKRLVIVPNYGLPARIQANGAPNVDVESELDTLIDKGYRTIRIDLDPFMAGAEHTPEEAAVWERMLNHLNEADVRIQVFSGMKRNPKPDTMLDDPQRIVRLHPIFDQYRGIQFEIVNAAAGNNLDIVQAARIFPNVHPGGLWWFNFRASTYLSTLQQRFEALPTSRSCIVASDARCIEWEYGKVLFVKSVLAQFLEQQIESGWTDLDGAQRAAQDWLYNAAVGPGGYCDANTAQ